MKLEDWLFVNPRMLFIQAFTPVLLPTGEEKVMPLLFWMFWVSYYFFFNFLVASCLLFFRSFSSFVCPVGRFFVGWLVGWLVGSFSWSFVRLLVQSVRPPVGRLVSQSEHSTNYGQRGKSDNKVDCVIDETMQDLCVKVY